MNVNIFSRVCRFHLYKLKKEEKRKHLESGVRAGFSILQFFSTQHNVAVRQLVYFQRSVSPPASASASASASLSLSLFTIWATFIRQSGGSRPLDRETVGRFFFSFSFFFSSPSVISIEFSPSSGNIDFFYLSLSPSRFNR